MKKVLLLVFIICLFSWSFSFAEGPLNIYVDTITPDVIEKDGKITGFDIEIWEEIAKDNGFEYTYNLVPFSDIINKVENGYNNVGIAAITKTSDREKRINFSHHYMDSGLHIAVCANTGNNVINSIISAPLMKPLLYLLIFIIICGHILWLAEKGCPEINDNYFPGIFEALWCVHATITTVGYGDKSPKTWTGRICAAIIAYTGIAACTVVISLLSSTLTTQKIKYDVSCLNDLKGKIVATKIGTTSEDILRLTGASVESFEDIDNAYTALINKEVKAVVFDAPNVLYFSKNEGKDKVEVVGDVFEKQYYGFAINKNNSSLEEKINKSLLKLRESGKYDIIYNKWFN